MSGIFNGTSIELLQKSMDAIWLRQQTIQNNIANSDTPGYKSKKVEFEGLLKLALKGAKSKDDINSAISKTKPRIVEDHTTATREDGNNVDHDSENVELARAQIQYEYLTSVLSSQINRLKYVINEGRG